ncbi:NUDIX domain-containing protein [Hoyosella rhizosphaerae]|uniref:Nudix hydrolase domain-containing protein n=1 Tax=Hoyosella rhizosphaerae TaxID=1755582 RepID=A0A916U4M3_9ACTN|nr:NUDIX domain-containing protein [Hoyosella rhizosphaerae]GGC59582.1 hypothetical protein GCM10011410_10000 [Hoyosella rhizosphaerae]
MLPLWVLVLTAVLVAVVVLCVTWVLSTASRLDRLHIRYDKAWHALDAALARRAVVARSVADLMLRSIAQDDAGSSRMRSEAEQLASLAGRAERADRDHREDAENRLSAALSRIRLADVSPQLVSELADAEARVLIARRFHNDAVGDTLALRRRRPVRLLKLAGTAPAPHHFEIVERHYDPPVELLRETVARSSGDLGASGGELRRSARIVVLDDSGKVLLMRGTDPQEPGSAFWFTPGGGVEGDESLLDAAVREMREETGVEVTAKELRGPVWKRREDFRFNGAEMRSEEFFYVYKTREFEPVTDQFTELEVSMVSEYRWCDSVDIQQLCADGEQVYPRELPSLLSEAARIANGAQVPTSPRVIT